LWAIAATLLGFDIVLASLAASAWQNGAVSLQVLHSLGLIIGFAVLIWGFWGGVVSTTASCITAFVVTVIAGRYSLLNNVAFSRVPFLMEGLLFVAVWYLCMQFLERELFEETADKRQLDRLEEEYLTLAIEYGKKEELLKVLQKKAGRFKQVESLGRKLRLGGAKPLEAIQVCLEEMIQVMGKGEAEVVLYAGEGVTRHPRGLPPIETPGGKDEVDRWLADHKTALLVTNLPHDVRFTQEFGRSRQIVSVLAVPLVWKDEVRGTLRFTSVVPQAFTHDELRFASEAAKLLIPVLFGAS
jgi:hypothetical protein